MKRDQEKAKLKDDLAAERKETTRLKNIVVEYQDVINMAYNVLDIQDVNFYGQKV